MPNRPGWIRGSVCLLTSLVFVLSGCSRAVTVPARELAPASEWHGLYRITTRTDSFTARTFAVTDSTIVIRELGGSDKKYGTAELPVTVQLQDVQSVVRLETNHSKTFFVALGGALFAAMIIALVTWDGPALD